MSKSLEKIILLVSDFIMIHCAFFLWCKIRAGMGFFSQNTFWGIFSLSFIVFLYWIFVFIFFGLYKTWFTRSRIDEFVSVVKTVTIGVFLIFLITFDLETDLNNPLQLSRLMIAMYWFMMIVSVGLGRITLRTVHRKLLERGIGHQRSLIVGWGKKARELHDKILKAPALGYDVIGFIPLQAVDHQKQFKDVPILGTADQLYEIIKAQAVQQILIALPRRSEKELQGVIAQCDGTPVGIKIVPDLYDVIIGQVRTNQIYGFPLIEILPQLMPVWESIVKRLLDILISLIFLIGFLPVWILIALAIVIDSKGSVFYTQKRVGKDGKHFSMIKFRSMFRSAETITGPVWATDNDPRITRIGRVLRRLRLDEIPQFINILDGDMSLVGPRPERPYFVDKLKEMFPLYTRRLRVRPGITGWAQVKGDYDQELEDVKEKLEYDLYYLENMSLRMDLKIILNTLYVMIRGKGQ